MQDRIVRYRGSVEAVTLGVGISRESFVNRVDSIGDPPAKVSMAVDTGDSTVKTVESLKRTAHHIAKYT